MKIKVSSRCSTPNSFHWLRCKSLAAKDVLQFQNYNRLCPIMCLDLTITRNLWRDSVTGSIRGRKLKQLNFKWPIFYKLLQRLKIGQDVSREKILIDFRWGTVVFGFIRLILRSLILRNLYDSVFAKHFSLVKLVVSLASFSSRTNYFFELLILLRRKKLVSREIFRKNDRIPSKGKFSQDKSFQNNCSKGQFSQDNSSFASFYG